MCIYIASRLSLPSPEFKQRKGHHHINTILSYLFNLKQSLKVAAELWRKGHYPFVPGYDLLLYLELESTEPRLPYGAGLEWVRRCDAILVVNGLEDSLGVQKEYREAVRFGKKIFFDVESIPDVRG
jgi:hypothetical protein